MTKHLLAALGLILVVAVASAQESDITPPEPGSSRTGVVIGKAEKQLTLWTKNGKETFTYAADTVMPLRKMKDGNLVWVRTKGASSKQAAQIIIIDDQVSVVGRLGREHAVVGTTWQGRSPSQLIVRAADGTEMFVIDPKTFRQPMPKPGQKVAVTYRIENVKPPNYIATGLIVLPAELEKSPVRITYTDVPQPEVVAEAPAPAPAPEPEPVIAQLPQTATQTPLAVALGLLLLVAGLAVRSYAR